MNQTIDLGDMADQDNYNTTRDSRNRGKKSNTIGQAPATNTELYMDRDINLNQTINESDFKSVRQQMNMTLPAPGAPSATQQRQQQ